MLLTTTNNNLFDTFFSDPWFNDPCFDERDVQKAQKKLYGHNGKRMMLTDNHGTRQYHPILCK